MKYEYLHEIIFHYAYAKDNKISFAEFCSQLHSVTHKKEPRKNCENSNINPENSELHFSCFLRVAT